MHKLWWFVFPLIIIFLYQPLENQRKPGPIRDWAIGFGLPSTLTKSINCPPDISYRPKLSEVAVWISDVFLNQCRGNFIDVGANEGVGDLSNSNELEKGLEWRGICIEPHPGAFFRMAPQRPMCRLINAGAAPTSEGFLEFLSINPPGPEMLSTFVDGMPPDHLIRIDSEIEKHGGIKKVINVALISISDAILGMPRSARFAVVDFLSIDVERRELFVLQGIDFEYIYFRAILLEENTNDDRATNPEVMATYGYTMYERRGFNTLYTPSASYTAAFIRRVANSLSVSVDSVDIGFQVDSRSTITK